MGVDRFFQQGDSITELAEGNDALAIHVGAEDADFEQFLVAGGVAKAEKELRQVLGIQRAIAFFIEVRGSLREDLDEAYILNERVSRWVRV